MRDRRIQANPAGGSREWGPLPRRLPKVREQRTFVRQDYVELHNLFSASFVKALSEEASRVLARTTPAELKAMSFAIARRSEGPSDQTTAPLAPILAHMHFALVPLARALTGRLLVPAHAWFNFYNGEDGMWLHIDSEGSELALVTTALGNVGPLHLHPELRGKVQDELERLQNDRSWNPQCGVPVAYPRLGLLAHRGNMIPHHRPGRPVAQPSAVAALHYAPLF